VNALDLHLVVPVCCVVGLIGGVLIHYGLKGLRR
jgi:uncharacterized protein YneF (UPF0154 family)